MEVGGVALQEGAGGGADEDFVVGCGDGAGGGCGVVVWDFFDAVPRQPVLVSGLLFVTGFGVVCAEAGEGGAG